MNDVRIYRENRNSFIKIPFNLFEYEEIKKMNDKQLVGYLKLLLSANIVYAKEIAIKIYEFNDLNKYVYIENSMNINEETIKYLESLNCIRFENKYLIVNRIWNRKFIRTSKDYKEWRLSVFRRDGFTCKQCAYKGKDLEAHHIKKWSTHFNFRYDTDNGITLCKKCHKELHRLERIENE